MRERTVHGPSTEDGPTRRTERVEKGRTGGVVSLGDEIDPESHEQEGPEGRPRVGRGRSL